MSLPPPSVSLLIDIESQVDNNTNNNETEEKEEEEKGDELQREVMRKKSPMSAASDNYTLPVPLNTVTSRSNSKIRKPVILVVDDVASNRKMLNRLLQDRCEYTIDATNGQEAVTIIRDALSQGRHIDIITMDYQMPVMDGPTATRRIRELGYKGIILGVTGNALADDINKFIACGANKVLIKPLNVLAFDKAVLELLPLPPAVDIRINSNTLKGMI